MNLRPNGNEATIRAVLVGSAVAILLLQEAVGSEFARLAVVVLATTLVAIVWRKLRIFNSTRNKAIFQGVAAFIVVACVWSGLNVIRYYTYDAAFSGRSPGTRLHWLVCEGQIACEWFYAVILVATLVRIAMYSRP